MSASTSTSFAGLVKLGFGLALFRNRQDILDAVFALDWNTPAIRGMLKMGLCSAVIANSSYGDLEGLQFSHRAAEKFDIEASWLTEAIDQALSEARENGREDIRSYLRSWRVQA